MNQPTFTEVPAISVIESVREERKQESALFSQKQFRAVCETFAEWLLFPPKIVSENFHLRHDTGKVKFVANGSTSDDTAMAFTLKLNVPNYVIHGSDKIVSFDEKTKTPIYGAEGRYYLSSTFRIVLLFEADPRFGKETKNVSIYAREQKFQIDYAKKAGVIATLFAENNLPISCKHFLQGFLSSLTISEMLATISSTSALVGALSSFGEFKALSPEEQKEFVKQAKKELSKGYEKMIFLMNLISVMKLHRVPSIEERNVEEGKFHTYSATKLDAQIKSETEKPVLSEYLDNLRAENEVILASQKENWKKLQLEIMPQAILLNMYREIRDARYKEAGYNPKLARQKLPTGIRPQLSPLEIYEEISNKLMEKITAQLSIIEGFQTDLASIARQLEIGKITKESYETQKQLMEQKTKDALFMFSMMQRTFKEATIKKANAAGVKLT